MGGATGNWSDASWADTAGGAGGAWVDGSKAIFDSDGAVTVSGASTMNVGQIENTGAGAVTFSCPVQFSGTYNVVANGAVKFPGGARATYPDDSLRKTSATANTLRLDGNFTFTADWTVPSIGNNDNFPWVVISGSTVRGKNVVGANSNNALILRIDEGGSAYFDSMAIGNAKGEISVDGYLEVAGNIELASACSLGRSGNIGTVKANCIKKVSGSSTVSCYIPNLIVGAGGLGVTIKDYYWQFQCDCVITATADFNFLGMYRSGNTHDWGLNLNSKKVTVNVPAGITVTCGIGIISNSGVIYKTGAGTLVMTDTYNNQSGYNKLYTGGTVINEGTVRLAANGQLGTGPVTIADGARLEIASGVTMSNVLDGDGTLRLENGATVSVGTTPWHAGTVEVASGATVTVTNTTGAAAAIAFLSGVSAADLPRFTITGNTLAVVDGVLVATGNTTGAYVWNGADGADWSVPGNWLVEGVVPATAPASTDTILFQNTALVTVGGTDPLTVTRIVTLSYDEVTFNCPVQFAGTYLVQNAATAPVFAGGATATYPDTSLSNENIPSHALRGSITFTEDWTIPNQPAGNPFVVAAGARVSGKTVTASTYQNVNYHLRIDEGAVATFETVAVAGKLVFHLNGGNLVATRDVTLGGDANGRDFGYYNAANDGTVEAHGIFKNVTGVGTIYHYITNMVVGAGGFGMYRKDYSIQFCRDAKLTAKDNLTIHQPIAGDGPKDGDWGLNLNGKTFTIDTAGHTVTFDSYVSDTAAKIVKEGEGEMIMQSRQKRHTGGTVLNGGLTTVKLAGALGYGTATVNNGATLAFADGVVAYNYPILVKAGGTLSNKETVAFSDIVELCAGSVLKPGQNAFIDARGLLVLPADGTVTVDMSDLEMVNGLPVKVVSGIADGDLAKFTAVVADGVSGGFSVSGGVLYYTVISGGVAADDLLWNPQGESVWSKTVAAWKNAGGEQVAFSDYANATVGTAANISIPKDVLATDVTISADENVTLSGAGKLGGSGSVLKTGAGVLTIDTTGGLEAQPIVVSAGTLRLGDNLTTRALGSSVDSSPVVVEKGATLDINYNNAEDNYDPARSSITHDKFIKIAGDGVDGKGAIVSTGSPCYAAFSDVVLTDDATIGGTVRSDFRHSTSYGFTRGTTRNTLTGPGKTLTVKNSAMLALVGTTVDLGSILVPEGGELRIEEASTWKVPGGIRLAGGKLSYYGSGANPGSVNIVAESGDSTISCGGGSPRISGSVTVKEGATLTHTGGTIDYNGGITGAFSQTGGTIGFAGPINDPIDFAGGDMYLNSGVPESGFTLNGTTDAGKVYFRQSGTFSDANITAQTFCVADVANSTVDVTFNNSTFNLYDLYLSWGSKDMANPSSGYLSIGPGTTLTVNKIGIGDDGTSTSNNIKSVMSVDGGTVHLIGTEFYIAHKGPHADFVVNSGTMTVDQATIRLRNSGQALGGYNTSRFIQNGGVFNYGGAGFTANFEDNTEDGQIVLKGGEMNASANWSIPQWISTCFKGGDADGWTLNQADGTTATWTTALQGDGDVTLNGAATLAGNKEVQGAVGGKWTVGDGFTAGLQGAASILGGLSVGDGASAKVNIATGRSAVFTARDFGNIPTNPDGECITNRFNKAIGGTTRGTITHDETFLFTKYNQTDRPFGNLNYQSTYALGQFYVEEGAAGTWSFTGKCDDYVQLWIDGVLVIATTGASNTGTATKELAAGWHSFRHVSIDNSGAFGDAQTIGYKDGSGTMSSYANFSVKNLKMRPAADFGDPGNANTVRWSHFKGNSSTVTANTYKNDDFNWSFCCITNNLGMLARYGKNDARLNNYAVNRFDGWFFVDGEDAGKEWTFRSNYDDRCALWIDGVDTGLDGNEGSTLSCTMVISRGWHRFRIQAADFSGNSGPWGGKGYPVSYQVAGGDQKNFSQENLVFSLCPDGYVQGDVTLASNARLENTAEGAACVYGNIVATGTGAVVAGGFKLDGGTLSFLNVAPGTRDLSTVLAFENPAEDFLADVGAINIDFTARPTRGTVRICAAGGLDAAGAAEKISVSINGEAFTRAHCTVEDGFLVAMIPVGTRVIIR